jgi:diguanylate cyclase (GGDEF)-like protein/PAS domain S-box-containing protein
MIVYATLSWYFLLNPIILAGDVSLLAVVVSLAYPIGDLALAFCLLMVIFSSKQLFSNDLILFFGAGLFTYIVADTAFVYLVTTETYDSGSWTDPLFILGVLLVGFTGLLQKNQSSIQLRKKAVIRTKPMLFAILFPFFGLTSLYLFMIFTTTGANAITIGVGLSILLVIVRQFLLLSENRRILQKNLKNADELQSSQERYRSLFEHHPDAAFSFTLDGTVLSVNEKSAEILGKTKEELIGHSLIDTIHADYQETVKEHFNNAKKGIFKNYELPLSNTDNEFYYLGVTHVPIKVDGEVIGVYAIARDITDNKINQEQIQYMAFHDHLTHLANRIRFEEVLQKTIEDDRLHDKKFALLFMDLNNFKDVNDDYGHAFGDKLLAQVARRIASMVKKDDCAARLGGDEFTILIDDLDSYDDAMRWASQLLNKLNKPYLIDVEEIVCTPSVGFAYYPKDGECVQDLLNKADAAMYKNKRHSKAM